MNDDFDFDGTQSRRTSAPMQIWDLLSILVLLLTVCVAGYFALIFINPDSPYNFLPPGQAPFSNALPTFTVTPIQLQSTWTPSPTLESTPTDTPRPTLTPLPTSTSPASSAHATTWCWTSSGACRRSCRPYT